MSSAAPGVSALFYLRFNNITPMFVRATFLLCCSFAAAHATDRLPRDVARDVYSKPHLVLPWLEITSGDTVADIFGSGGYYSEILATHTGPSGNVILLNNAGFEAWGINILQDRFSNRDPGKISQRVINGIELELEPESLDAALIVMAFHDLYVTPKRYNGEAYVPVGKPAEVDYFLQQILEALKPGGRFVIVDHSGDETMPADDVYELHRMHESVARSAVTQNGFKFIAAVDVLRNPQDARTHIVFDPEVKGQTDRFVLVFEKP